MAVDLVRDSAVSTLLRVFGKQAHVDSALDRTLRRARISARGARFMTHLVYGVVRHKLLCDHILSGLCEQPLDKIPEPVLMTLRMGVFQALFCNNVTRPALVHTTVELAKRRGHAGFARMANAVMRRVPDRLDDVLLPDRTKDPANYLRVRYSMPRWMVRLWMENMGLEEAERFCAACNEPAPVTLRVNTLKTDKAALRRKLADAGIATASVCDALDGLIVQDGPHPLHCKWFAEGHYLMQDPAAMLAAHLVDPQPGECILDMCAAPGGKTTHLSALSGGRAVIVAMDWHRGRMLHIRENCDRMAAPNIALACGDGRTPPFAPETFDRVLIDAPCSGLGTLRRHPEIKWRTQMEMPAQLAATQRDLLRKALQLCKNGGLVVYSVCTVTRQETGEVVSDILAEGNCVPEDGQEHYQPWRTSQGQYQTSPLDAAWDGFFLMRFRKRS